MKISDIFQHLRLRRASRAAAVLSRYYADTIRRHRRQERKEIARMVQRIIAKGAMK